MKEEKSTKKGIKFCPKCGSPIKEDSLFCENCGFNLSKGEGKVKDLAEKLERGEITAKEAKRELKRRELHHHRVRLKEIVMGLIIVTCLLLIYFPTFAKVSKFEFLSFFAQLPSFDFPLFVKLLVSVILALGFFMLGYAGHLLSSKGGLKKGDETVKFIREGPYKIIAFGMLCLFILPPFIFPIHYTILAPVGQLILLIEMPLATMGEDKINVRKWGDEYRQYMKEVPRWNIIKGLWNLRR